MQVIFELEMCQFFFFLEFLYRESCSTNMVFVGSLVPSLAWMTQTVMVPVGTSFEAIGIAVSHLFTHFFFKKICRDILYFSAPMKCGAGKLIWLLPCSFLKLFVSLCLH